MNFFQHHKLFKIGEHLFWKSRNILKKIMILMKIMNFLLNPWAFFEVVNFFNPPNIFQICEFPVLYSNFIKVNNLWSSYEWSAGQRSQPSARTDGSLDSGLLPPLPGFSSTWSLPYSTVLFGSLAWPWRPTNPEESKCILFEIILHLRTA